mgnify:FL=1
MPRLTVVLTGLLFIYLTAGVPAQDASLQSPPQPRPADAPRLAPLRRTDNGTPIRTASQWRNEREAIQSRWLEFMGQWPSRRAPLKTEWLQSENFPEFTRQFVRYQIEDGVWTDGYLLTPKGAKKRLPAVVVFHPTTPLQAKGVAGVDESYPEEKRMGPHIAARGYVVWCPRNFIFDEGADWKGNTRRMQQRHPDWTGMTRMTWDAIRAADFLESLSFVDRRRIGCIGHSLGGKVALYAGAFDERYKAVVSSEGGIGLRFSNWDAAWYFGPQIKQFGFPLENHQVLALIAPRAFLLLAGESADNDKGWAFIEAVQPVYKITGAAENIGWFNHRQGHAYSPEARAVAEWFLDKHLKK